MINRQAFYDERAQARLQEADNYYQRYLARYFAYLVPSGKRVLEVGCGLGDLLAALKPADGLGIDFSPALVALARTRHPQLNFQMADALNFSCDQKFDHIILSDLVNDLPDVQAVFERLQMVAHPGTRLILNSFNNLWRPILGLAEKMELKSPNLLPNWLSKDDIINLLHLAGWEVVKTDARLIWPAETSLVANGLNRWLAPLLPDLCLTIVIVARPKPKVPEIHFRCTVVVPARNEAGNIEALFRRIPEMGLGTEIVIIEGHSKDNSWEEIMRVAALHPGRQVKILKQQSKGKGGAVREAFAVATGDLWFILDADLSVPPEDLTKFYQAARSGAAEFVNGVRLVYPMEDGSMQFFNMLANKFFGLAFSWLLGQKIKDTLCGTKVLFRRDYLAIEKNRAYFGEFDPFGDFDLLFGAAKLNLRIVDLPVRYQARTYGTTNIQRLETWLAPVPHAFPGLASPEVFKMTRAPACGPQVF